MALSEKVSIHAPAWGATRKKGLDLHLTPVSIHAPAWGATMMDWQLLPAQLLFQSTHPRGVRPGPGNPHRLLGWFQSTHPRGVRLGHIGDGFAQPGLFQSTHPRGVRPPSPPHGDQGRGFNPRTRVGCDPFRLPQPPRENRFQSTHPRGVRHVKPIVDSRNCGRFNPRTRVGCDLDKGIAVIALQKKFQSTHPRGVRPAGKGQARRGGVVSIHAPAWGATGHSGG